MKHALMERTRDFLQYGSTGRQGDSLLGLGLHRKPRLRMTPIRDELIKMATGSASEPSSDPLGRWSVPKRLQNVTLGMLFSAAVQLFGQSVATGPTVLPDQSV